jgi:NADH-quinone oxidoreductase subunit F
MSYNLSALSGRKGLEDNLFEQLGRAAAKTGAVSLADTERLAEEFLMGKANTLGAASFYDFTREENRGKKAYVCRGSACMCAGTQDDVEATLKASLGNDAVGSAYCLGRCHENRAFLFEGQNFSGDAINRFDEIKQANASSRATITDSYCVEAIGTRVLTATPNDIDTYYALLFDCLKKSPEELIAELQTSGLRGRGGAGFPTAFKLDSCRKTPSDTKFIVCNADEGDPGAYSDRYLLEYQIHRVLLGMMLAGYITGAQYGVVYIRGEYPESIQECNKAIQHLHEKQLLGTHIGGTSFSFHFKVIHAQGAYICGEETALLSSIEGQRPEVRVRPPYPAQVGLFNKPTVVSNVETLACIPFILKEGGAAFAAIGEGKSTGTKLVSLDSFFNKPGIYEVPMGTPLTVVFNQLGGGFTQSIKAFHIGGPLGGLVPTHRIPDLVMSFESFQQNGFLMGHASVVCIPESFPLVNYLHHLFEFTAHESCGKCFPCRLGSTRGKELFEKAIHEGYQIDETLLNDLLETMEIGSLCALGGGLPLPVKNALHYFKPELQAYLS